MLKVAIFNTITGRSFDHIDNSQIIDDALVTLATGSEASTATIDIALNKAQASGWRNRFAKLDKSIAIYEERQTASGTVRDVHYAGFIDKVAAEGAANGGLVLSVRLSDPAELLKMIRISADKTYKAATWRGILKQLVADAFSQPNTPDVTIKGGLEPGDAVTFKAEAGSSGATYSGLIEEVKEASNGGYAEVAFTPKAQTSSGSLDAVTWEAEADSQLINLSKTVDVEDSENVYGFTIDSDSNSNFSRLVLKNAEGKSKTYTNPNGGTLLSDNVLEVDAAESDFDAIAAAYMKSEHLATSESHEVGVKMTLAAVRGVLGAVGVLPKAVEYSWSTSTRLRVVQAEYRIHMSSPASAEARAVVPVDLTFAPISNKTWVPPSRAAKDSLNQDWIDRNKYSGVGRDSYSGAHPGDYGGGVGGGGDTGGGDTGGGGSTPDKPENSDLDKEDPAWWAGTEPMEFPDQAKSRQRPVYSLKLGSEPGVSFKSMRTAITPNSDLMAGPQDDAMWMYGLNGTTGQGHTGDKLYWTYWSTTEPTGLLGNLPTPIPQTGLQAQHGTDLGFALRFTEGTTQVNGSTVRQPMKPVPLDSLALNVCEGTLEDGKLVNARRVSRVNFTKEQQVQLAMDFTMNGSEGDYEFLTNELGVTHDTIKNSSGSELRWATAMAGVRGIFTSENMIIIPVESYLIMGNSSTEEELWYYPTATINGVRYIRIPKRNGDWDPAPKSAILSNGGMVKFWTGSMYDMQWPGGPYTLSDVIMAGSEWLGVISHQMLIGGYDAGGTAGGGAINIAGGVVADSKNINKLPPLVPRGWSSSAGNAGPDYVTTTDWGAPWESMPSVIMARGTKNQGMSLYTRLKNVYIGKGDSLDWRYSPKQFELTLADNGLAAKSSSNGWFDPVLFADSVGVMDHSTPSGSQGCVIEGIPVSIVPQKLYSTTEGRKKFQLHYLTRVTPQPTSGSIPNDGSTDWRAEAKLDYQAARSIDGGNTAPGGLEYAHSIFYQAGDARRNQFYYHDGWIYSLNFLSEDLHDYAPWYGTDLSNERALMSLQGALDLQVWCDAVKVTVDYDKPPVEESTPWYNKYGDVPLNPASKDLGSARELESRYPYLTRDEQNILPQPGTGVV